MRILTYRELTERPKKTLHSLQEWLGIEPIDLQPQEPIRKQRLQPREEIVLNLAELRERIAREHSEWLMYFDEPEVLIDIH